MVKHERRKLPKCFSLASLKRSAARIEYIAVNKLTSKNELIIAGRAL
jgi:hypothetical protein